MDKFFKYAATVGIISLVATTPIFGQSSTPKFEIITPSENQTVYGTKIPQDTYTFPDVAFGEHTLQAELVTNDHKSLKPPQVVSAKFKNEAIPQSEQSQTTGFDKKTAAVILVVVALVIVAAWWYTKDEDEEEMEKPARKIKKTSRRKKI